MKTLDDYIGILTVTVIASLVIDRLDSREAAEGAATVTCVIAVYLVTMYLLRRLRNRTAPQDDTSHD